jgi:hypothetical protein
MALPLLSMVDNRTSHRKLINSSLYRFLATLARGLWGGHFSRRRMDTQKTIRAMRRVIRDERRILKYTQEELAHKTGLGMSTIKAAENGRCGAGCVTLDSLLRIMDGLDLSPLDFWERVEGIEG